MRHLSLSQRVKLTFVLSFFALSAISVGLIFTVTKSIEDHIFETQLLQKISEYQQTLGLGGQPKLPADMSVYQELEELPERIQGLIDETEPGIYEVTRPDDLDYHYAIVDSPHIGRQIFVFDVSQFELSEETEAAIMQFFAFCFGVLVIAFFVLFQLVIKRALAPMHQLIAQVRQQSLKPDKAFKYQHPDDNELGLLSRVLNDHSQRIEEFIQREREFTAFVSHELRTPQMVIKGAAELLQLQANPALEKPLDRINRAIASMEDTTEVLLTLTREQPHRKKQKINANELLKAGIEGFEKTLGRCGKSITVYGGFDPNLTLEKAPAEVVFANVIKNAIVHSNSEIINIDLDATTLVLTNSTEVNRHSGVPDSTPERDQNYGLGQLIMQRICNEYDWAMESSKQGSLFRVQIIF